MHNIGPRRSSHRAMRMKEHLLCLLMAVLVLCLAGTTSQANADEKDWSPPPLMGDSGEIPDGRQVVQRTIDFMETHESLRFEALFTYEAVQENGQKLQFDVLQNVAISRPQRLYWKTLNDDATTVAGWLKDGTFTMLRQPANLWGQVIVPPTLTAAVKRLSDEYNVAVPFVDLLSGDIEELWLGEDVETVEYVGEAWAEGYWTDHVAIRKPGVDVQLWFRQGDEPFPVKMAIIRTDEESMPGSCARFRSWSTELQETDIPPFAPPEGSEQLEIAP